MGKENMKELVPHDLSPMPFLGHLKEQVSSPYKTRETVRIIGNPKEIHNAKAQEDEGDMDVGWDITSKDVERLRQFLTPTIHTLPNLEPVVQPYIPLGPVHDKDKIVREKELDYNIPLNDSVMPPLTPQMVHITPPGDDYVTPAINPMSNKQLNKFKEEFSHIKEEIKSLQEDRDNLKDFRQISNLEAMLREFLLVEIILFIIDSGCSKHITGNLKLLRNITIKRVYYVEGLNHNLFSVGQFCDADLEVAFRKSTCYIRDLKGNGLLTGSRGTYLYSITLQDTSTPNPICLMAKARSSQAWLWHRCLSHLNFDSINLLSKNDIVIGLP
ncbi:retrovirus-related pol polyprotein from transposon TNT 1-94 [Tanacetum coccineum]